jgi:mannose-6-phosphate isomerase
MNLTMPFRCEPFLRALPWGDRRLATALSKPLPPTREFSESWEVSDHASHSSRIATGPAAGMTLRQVMQESGRALLGKAGNSNAVFPWLIKWLDCDDWLSVQVHPDDETAPRLWPGERGKTEAWFVLQADPGARIYAGLKPGVDASVLKAAAEAGTVADCLHSFTPRPGDFVFLPAGTVHAVGGGVLMAEVQQTSDATFRLFDWNRRDAQGKSRQLHVEEALQAIHGDAGPVRAVATPLFGKTKGGAATQRQALCSCPYFELEYVASGQAIQLGGQGRLQAWIVIEGSGVWETSQQPVSVGQVWVVPASAPAMECRPQEMLGGILCSLPS